MGDSSGRAIPLPSASDKVQLGLGRAIGEARKESGMTREELAERVDLEAAYIGLVEEGRRNPTWGVVRRISRALDVPLAELARRAEELERDL